MLYGKIYLDTDKDGRDTLVFVALVTEASESFRASMVDYIAISPEAKVALLARLNDPNRRLSRVFGDFELWGDDDGDHGVFSFKEKSVENGQRIRILGADDLFSVKLSHGCRRSVLEYMVPCNNEILKELDLRNSVDENELWERYYADMFARGETLACDVDTIKKTPLAFLTEEQKEMIKRDYRERCDDFGDYHNFHHREEVDDFVVRELMKTYSKRATEIEKIVGIRS